jgi:hypothetical protein
MPIAIAGSVGFIMIGTEIEGATSGLGFIHIKALHKQNLKSDGFLLFLLNYSGWKYLLGFGYLLNHQIHN